MTDVFVEMDLLWLIRGDELVGVAATALGCSASNEVSTSGGSMDTLIHPVGVMEVLRVASLSVCVARRAAT